MKCNDVVDLVQASKESNWKRKNFLNKIFSAAEQFQISNSKNKNLVVWLFWSMKESAYKINVRQSSKRFFAPQKYECKLIYNQDGNYYGEVLFDKNIYSTTSEISSNTIFTIAEIKNDLMGKETIYEKISFPKTDYQTQHNMIYAEIIKKISSIYNRNEELFSIKKDELNIPHLFFENILMHELISISHHGNTGAYVIQH